MRKVIFLFISYIALFNLVYTEETFIDKTKELRRISYDIQIPKQKMEKNNNENIRLETISDLEKKYLIHNFLINKDVKNILSRIDGNIISTNTIAVYKVFLDNEKSFPVILTPLNESFLFYVPQTKLNDGTYIRSFAKVIGNGKDKNELISEYGKLITDENKKINKMETQGEISCGPCITLPNGFHEGEEKGTVLDTDWSCVGEKQGLCAATCALLCVPPNKPDCAKCVASCESAAIYSCTHSVVSCVRCDDAPLPGDFRIIR